MKRSIPDLEKQVVEGAKALFLEKGLLAVEMKDIAEKAGISRSTLYRHYPDKIDIAFEIIQPEIVELYEIRPECAETESGAAFAEAYLKIFLQKLTRRPETVRMLREFDMLYDSGTPSRPSMEKYESFFRDYRSPLYEYVVKGQRDGSIRDDMEANELVYILTNSVITLVQRLLPRSEVYLREHGFGDELLENALRVLMDGIRK